MLRALRRNKLRSLTTLIVIGVAAAIAMVSIGRGANVAVQQQIASLGTNLLMVIPGATTSGGARSGWGGMSTLTVRDGEAIRAEATAVEDVTWFKRSIAQVVYGDANWSTSVQGTTASYSNVRQWPVAKGSFFTQRDDMTANRVAVLGQTVVDNLFGPGGTRSTRRSASRRSFRVIGVLPAGPFT
jgi:putative ABC transport system permease protein